MYRTWASAILLLVTGACAAVASDSSGGSAGTSGGGGADGGIDGASWPSGGAGAGTGATAGTSTGGAAGSVALDAGSDAATLSCDFASGKDCSAGPGSGENCVFVTSCFKKMVQDAVQHVIATNPTWFDTSGGSALVLQVESYMDAVVAEVNAANDVCCIRDPNAGDEIVVKHDNGFAENFDILTWDNYARWGDLIYTSTCPPAWF